MSEPQRPPPRPKGKKGAVVKNVARAQPQKTQPGALAPGAITSRLKDGAEDAALNAVSIAKEGVQDFLKTDRFFKYKALVVAIWAATAAAGLYIAWPESGFSFHVDEELGAHLVIGEDPNHPVFMVVNQSNKTWERVVVTVNREFTEAKDLVPPLDNITVTPQHMAGKHGPPPSNLRAVDLVVRTSRGRAVLLKDGKLQ